VEYDDGHSASLSGGNDFVPPEYQLTFEKQLFVYLAG
jgi:hypothetical protein